MPITKELLNKIGEYEKQGYTPDEIVGGLKASQNYPDVAKKIMDYEGQQYSSIDILQGIKASPIDIEKPETSGTIENFFIGTGYGMDRLRLGAQQLGASVLGKMGLVSPETVKSLSEEVAQKEQMMKPLMDESTSAKIGQFVGETVPTMPIPGGVTGGIAKRLGTSAIVGAIQGAIQPTTEKENRLTNTILGATIGAAGQGVLSGVGKVYNAIKSPIQTPTQKAADAWNIRLTLGEASDNPLWQKAETWLENIPLIGLKGFRREQQREAEAASYKWLSQYVADPANTGNLVIAREANRESVGQMFEAIKGLVGQVKTQEIKPDETRRIVSGLLKRYPDIFKEFQDTEREKLLRNIASDVADKQPKPLTTIEKWNQQLDRPEMEGRNIVSSPKLYNADSNSLWFMHNPKETSGSVEQWRGMFKGMKPERQIERLPQSPVPTPTTLTLDEAWTLRKGLGEMIGQARKKLQSGAVDHTQLSEISQAYGAISRDIDKWIDTIGRQDIKEAFKTANEAYKQYVVRFDILDDAMARAIGQRGAGEMFSPKTLSTELKNIAWKEYKLKDFTPQQIEEMTGLANILQVVKRAGQYKENPPTGNRWGIPVMGALTTWKAIPAVAITRFVSGTEAGKRFAVAASRIEPTNPMMEGLLRGLPRAMNQEGIDITGGKE